MTTEAARTEKSPSKRLNLTVQYACKATALPLRAQIRAWVRAALDVDGKKGGEITVRLVDEELQLPAAAHLDWQPAATNPSSLA